MDISLEYYRVFYQAARLGSITLAAEYLCITQPAVSQAVKQLETALNCRLFVRTSKGVHLTQEGELLYGYVERGLGMILDGEQTLRRMQDLDTGEVRIGASDMTLEFYLLPYLEQFHETYPNVKVMVSNATTPETMKSLHGGKIDFGVVSTPVASLGDARLIPVREIQDVFVAGEKFKYLRGKCLPYARLEELPCILLEGNTSTRAFIDLWLEEQGVKLAPEFELATSDMVVQFAVRNMGVGCVVEDFAREKLDSGRLFCLEFDSRMPARQICVATDRESAMSPAGRKLLEMLLRSQGV